MEVGDEAPADYRTIRGGEWVLGFPHRLRYRLAWDDALRRQVTGVAVRAVVGFSVTSPGPRTSPDRHLVSRDAPQFLGVNHPVAVRQHVPQSHDLAPHHLRSALPSLMRQAGRRLADDEQLAFHDVDVAVGSGLVASHRAEQRQRAHVESLDDLGSVGRGSLTAATTSWGSAATAAQ